jgi:TonB family protein
MRPLVIAILALMVGRIALDNRFQFQNGGGTSNATPRDASPPAKPNPAAGRGETNLPQVDGLAIKATRVEESSDRTLGNHEIKVFLEIENAGHTAACRTLSANLETTAAVEYGNVATSGEPDLRSLPVGETTRGWFLFNVPGSERPLILRVRLLSGRPGCSNNSGAIPRLATAVVDLHSIPGSNAPNPEAHVDLGPGYTSASCTLCPNPKYTEALRHERVQGTVALQVAIQADGTTAALEVTKSSGDVDLDRRAFEAVKTWHFRPAAGPDGVPTSSTEPVEVTFRTD